MYHQTTHPLQATKTLNNSYLHPPYLNQHADIYNWVSPNICGCVQPTLQQEIFVTAPMHWYWDLMHHRTIKLSLLQLYPSYP